MLPHRLGKGTGDTNGNGMAMPAIAQVRAQASNNQAGSLKGHSLRRMSHILP